MCRGGRGVRLCTRVKGKGQREEGRGDTHPSPDPRFADPAPLESSWLTIGLPPGILGNVFFFSLELQPMPLGTHSS